MDKLTVICKLKEGHTISDAAMEVWQLLGKGGNPNAPIIEEYVGFVNTPISNGYFRSQFDAEHLPYLEGIQEIDASDAVEIIKIEYDGQEMFQTGTHIDQDGTEQPEYLGMTEAPLKLIEVTQ